MRVTDATRTKVVDIPPDLAIVSGIFKDMIESGAHEGPDPVVLDASLETFDMFIAWFFHRERFVLTKDNVEPLLELAIQLEVTKLSKDIEALLRLHNVLSSGHEAYVVGVIFGLPEVERFYRSGVIWSFDYFLKSPELFNKLVDRCPSKVYELVKDGVEKYGRCVEMRIQRKAEEELRKVRGEVSSG